MNARMARWCTHTIVLFVLGVALVLSPLPVHAGDTPTAGNSPNIGTTGDPTSTSVGEYYFAKSLLDLGGPLPLRFTLYYGSYLDKWLATGADAFVDCSFTHNYQLTLRVTSDNALGIFYAQGDLLWFSRVDGAWRIVFDEINYQLREDAGYYYLLDPMENLVYTFAKASLESGDRVGLLVRIEDRNGNALTFTNDPATNLLTRVTDGLGRSLDFAYANPPGWTDNPHLVRVTDQASRTVRFQYGQVAGFPNYALTVMTDTLGLRTTFEYLPTRPRWLTRQVLPRGNAPYTQTYAQDPSSLSLWRVVAQTNAYSQTTRLSFDMPMITHTTTITDPLGNAYRHTHQQQRTLTGWADATGRSATWAYDSLGRPITVTDRLGDVTTITYHAETGRIASITNAKGATVASAFSPQVQAVTNPLSPTLTYSFTFYNLTRVDYPDGTSERYSYDERGNMLTYTDPAGQVWQYTYSGRGQVLTARTPTGGVITYTYNADGTVASTADSDTGVTIYGYDGLKRLTRITYPDSASLQTAYDAADRLTAITDPNGRTYTFQLDANGNLTRVTDPLGNSTQYAYDLMDRLVQTTDRLGKVRRWSYDALGRVVSYTDATNVVTTYGYDSRGWISRITQGGKTWQLGYDDEGIPASLTTPSGDTVSLGSDPLGYSISMTNALGNTASILRDALQRPTALTDPLGRTINYTYDARGLLAAATRPVVGATSYERNDLGLLARLTDPRGSQWRFTYTGLGRPLSSTDPLGRGAGLAYDSRGRLWRLTLPDGTTAELTYDAADNVTRMQYSTGPDLHYTYDALDRLVSTEGITLTYDAEGQIITTNNLGRSYGATYDDAGRLRTATYNNGTLVVTYIYSPTTGLLMRVSDNLSSARVDMVYNDDLRFAGFRRSNGIHTDLTWDNAGRLVGIKDSPAAGSPLLDLQYSLDPAGQVTQMSMIAPLDPASVLANASSLSLSHDAASQINSAGYTYDALGRLLTAPGHTYAWDGASRLVGVDGVRLGYNGLGDVITRTEGAATTYFHYNYAVAGAPIMAEMTEEAVGGASETAAWLQDLSAPLARRYYVWTPSGQLLYAIDATQGNKVSFYHFDRAGSTLALSDAAGQVTDAYAYDPYGQLLAHQGSSTQPFTFQGRYGIRQEGSSGALYHVRMRYYAASLARFISPDPIWPADPSSPTSPYAYADANPLRFGDVIGAQADLTGSFFNSGFRSVSQIAADLAKKEAAQRLVLQRIAATFSEKTLARGTDWALSYQRFGSVHRLFYESSSRAKVLGQVTQSTLNTMGKVGSWSGPVAGGVAFTAAWVYGLAKWLDPSPELIKLSGMTPSERQAYWAAQEERKRAADEEQYRRLQEQLAAEKAVDWQRWCDLWKGTGLSEADLMDLRGRLGGLYGEGTPRWYQELRDWIQFAKAGAGKAQPSPSGGWYFDTTTPQLTNREAPNKLRRLGWW